MFSKSLLRTASLCLLMAAPAIPSAPAAGEVPRDRQQITLSFAPLVQKVGPAVVNIYTKTVTVDRRRGPFGDPFFEQFFGDMFGVFSAGFNLKPLDVVTSPLRRLLSRPALRDLDLRFRS